ncbi:NUDIX domain-containing protein [Enterococcus durans]|uniref:NUDIX hydrolase n=1 Tax=Enterococcus durans TaxID=53345 RepID=UPI00187DE3C9|nr:NUDIX domain-containing protein [Enterococcus durans]MBE8848323.1 NUDIX domain-containing protein [Enterococcus durans]MDB1653706.1 NUDIX domain-containing protein [Enterococcus durans]MDB1654938.1 NUDIX domain-containing protein [Enterococcus durans]MDB1664010.1 NUDIX domain-containing protein [Enterococcus durans]MDB1669608.1 NUDIX domain-containing protein [Enterococcus durans]
METRDISYTLNGVTIKVRSCGFLINDEMILVHKKKYDDFYALVGGNVKLGESTEKAIHREFGEELNISIEIKQLVWVVENFYTYDSKKVHEFMFVYLIDTNNELPAETFEMNSNIFSWFSKSELSKVTLKPNFLNHTDDLIPNSTMHIINVDSNNE